MTVTDLSIFYSSHLILKRALLNRPYGYLYLIEEGKSLREVK